MKTQQLTLLSYFFKDFRTIDKIFKGTKQKLASIDFDMPEEDEYLHLTDVHTFKNTVVASKDITPEGDEIRREYKLKNYSWSDKPSIKNDLDLVYMRKYRAEDKE
jgi:hypothetical protein